MAVYQGARQRAITLPRRPASGIAAPALPRRRTRAALRARRGTSRTGLVLGGIVIAFVCAFFSLAQDVQVSAVGYEADRLATLRERMQAQADDLNNELNRLGKAPAIRRLAIDAGLGALPAPIVIPAN
jgi:hypothetical protein